MKAKIKRERKNKMNKQIFNMIEYPKQGIISKTVIKNSNVDIGLFCMVKNTEMSEHTSTKPGTVYVVEGRGIFNLKGKDIKMLPGTLIFMEKNAKHSLKAIENMAFILTLF